MFRRLFSIVAALLLFSAAQATVHRLGPSTPLTGTISIPDRFPSLLHWDFATQGIGNWGAPLVGAAYSVVNGEFEARNFGNDDNHTPEKGGPGRLFLPVFADHHYFRYTLPDGSVVGSDLTNALVEMEVRGIEGFQIPSGCSYIVWITADHPDFPAYPATGYKIANWGFVGEPRPITSDWQKVSWRLDPNGSWVFGAGIGIYSEPLALREALQHVHNLHTVILCPANTTAPTGAFRMRNPQIVFNKNGPGLLGQRWGNRAPAVSLLNGDLTASHGAFTTTGGVRSAQPLHNGAYWETKHLTGNLALSFAFGVANSTFDPAVQSSTFFADVATGWGYMINSGNKRHGGPSTDVALGPSSFPAGTVFMGAYKDGKVWFGANGTWFGGGDPATDTNPAYTGLTGDIYAMESNGTGNGSWTFKGTFAAPFAHSPPAGFSGAP